MVSGVIRVSKVGSGETEIAISNWPDRSADWRVSTVDRRGRELHVVGYHFGHGGWRDGQAVGDMTLHVDSRKPLMIRRYKLADTLVQGERAEALASLVLCVQAVAVQLRAELRVGTGCVEWQFDRHKADDIHRQFPAFQPSRKRNPLRRGQRYARWCP